jgi:hypothetical protein
MSGSATDLLPFPPLLILQEHWRTIAAECAAIDRSHRLPIARGDRSHQEVAEELVSGGRPGWIEAWGPEPRLWWNYGFVHEDQLPFGDAGAPQTVALLQRLRGLRVAALSLFRPGANLPVHQHDELRADGILTFHLGLQMAADYSYLWVDGTFIREEEGKGFVFDGSRPHFAFNSSDRDRLILYLEFYADRLAWL